MTKKTLHEAANYWLNEDRRSEIDAISQYQDMVHTLISKVSRYNTSDTIALKAELNSLAEHIADVELEAQDMSERIHHIGKTLVNFKQQVDRYN